MTLAAGTGVPLKLTVEVGVNFVPVRVTAVSPLPAGAAAGVRAVRVGAGSSIVRVLVAGVPSVTPPVGVPRANVTVLVPVPLGVRVPVMVAVVAPLANVSGPTEVTV